MWVQGAGCTHANYGGRVPKIMQIRDVPDDVHDALSKAAQGQGLSLNRYVLRELEHVARREQVAQENAAIIRRTQAKIRSRPDREVILSVLDDGRRG